LSLIECHKKRPFLDYQLTGRLYHTLLRNTIPIYIIHHYMLGLFFVGRGHESKLLTEVQ
jgi:hypothetical protein